MPRTPDLTHGPAIRWLMERGAVVTFGQKDCCNYVKLEVRTSKVHSGTMIIEGYDFLDLVLRAMEILKKREPRYDEKELVMGQLGEWLKEKNG